MEKLVLIDGNSLLNRAFYATPPFTTKDGLPTNAVFGFVKLMLKIIADKKPSYFAVAFDLHAPTFRHLLYKEYKAGRKPMPEELAVQMPIIKEVLRIMDIKILEKAGFEADDLLGTVAKKFDVQTYIYTGDRDSYQLVDKTTSVCFTRKGVSDILELNDSNFQDETGLTPAQIIDLKALMGDKSDNIPGIAGVGEKSAMTLLQRYSTLDGVYAHLDEVTGALHAKLETGKDTAYFSQKLATINVSVPLDIELSDCLLKMPFAYALKKKFAQLEFKSLQALENIYKEADEVELAQEQAIKTAFSFSETYPEKISEVLQILDEYKQEYIAFELGDTEFRFALLNDDKNGATEYIFPIKINLLDPGFFETEFTPIYKRICFGEKRVIFYNAKEVMHRLKSLGITVTAPFDDVSILKCIADGLSNSDGLSLCLNQNDISDKARAGGLLRLYQIYSNQLNDEEKRLYNEVELPLIPVLFDMEKTGVCVNYNALVEFSTKFNTELDELKRCICALAGEEFNINSTQQLGKILFEKLRIGSGAKKNKESKSYKTTAEELEKYAENHEIVRKILRYRTVQKINSTYIEGFKPMIKNGKVHTTYNQSNTATGRLSSANPNLQNIPVRTDEGRSLRKLFTASEGNVLIDADYSQIELRLLAHFSKSEPLINAYCNEIDIHTLTASQVFNTPKNEVTSQMRRAAKAVNFGIIYGISAFGLSKDLGISAKKAQEYIDKYFESYNGVKEYMQQNIDDAKNNGFVKTLLGRKRVINEIQSSNHNLRQFGERAAMNMPLQGSSADIIKVAMINVHKKLQEKGYKAKLLLQVHDELIIDCPKNEVDEVSLLLKTEMENAVKLRVPLTVDIGVGETWLDCK